MATVTSTRPYHIIIFGASGFTGQFVVEEVARSALEGPSGSLKWALAGRSRQRLEGVLNQAAEMLRKPELRTEVEIIVADVSEADSLAIMCQQGLVVLNCVGPYRFYGEPVVKACIENGAHCIDICGEPQFLERMQLDYHSRAMDSGVYVIGSCGFDSIPADMGILYTRNQFKGTLTAVESFLTVHTGPEGGCAHDGTWQSAIYGFADSGSLRKLRKKFGHQPLPVVGAKVKKRGSLFFSKEIDQYAIPFMGSDPSVVRRSQRFLYEEHQELPVQYSAYMEGTSFSLTFFGEGYAEGLDPSQGRPNARICTQIHGAEPGYVATPVAMVQAAITVLNEPQFLPIKGGVYSPGAAFARTTLIDRLNRHGLVFSVKRF
ncbi:unnamed protein product [Coregonus sp. 'balchen']|nr:unnamed protein product [Coregonus sp. 'balchen']